MNYAGVDGLGVHSCVHHCPEANGEQGARNVDTDGAQLLGLRETEQLRIETEKASGLFHCLKYGCMPDTARWRSGGGRQRRRSLGDYGRVRGVNVKILILEFRRFQICVGNEVIHEFRFVGIRGTV